MPKSFLFTHKRYDYDEEIKEELEEDEEESAHYIQDLTVTQRAKARGRGGGDSINSSGFSEEDDGNSSPLDLGGGNRNSTVKFVRGAVGCGPRRHHHHVSNLTISTPSPPSHPKKRRLVGFGVDKEHSVSKWKEEMNNNYHHSSSLEAHHHPQLHIKEVTTTTSPLNSGLKNLILSGISGEPTKKSSSKLSSLQLPNGQRGNIIQFCHPSSPEQISLTPQQPNNLFSYQIKLISPPPGGTLAQPNYTRESSSSLHQIKSTSSRTGEKMTPPSPLQFIIAAAEQQQEAAEEEEAEKILFIEGSRSEEGSQQYQDEEPTNQLIHHQEQPVNLSVKKVDLFNLTQLAEVSIAAAKREMSLRSSNVSNTNSPSSSPTPATNNTACLASSLKVIPEQQQLQPKPKPKKENSMKLKRSGGDGELGSCEKIGKDFETKLNGEFALDSPIIGGNEEGTSSGGFLSSSSSSSVSSSSSSQRHRCVECGKGFSTLSNLARHRQTHRSLSDASAVKKCPHCDKVYVSMPAFSMHLRTHNQGCKCPYCGKGFSRPWLLQGHIRTHTGEKPFKCGICSKAFADKSNLRAHTQTHSTEKPFVCSRCGKPFALKSYLCKHIESSCMKSNRPSGPSPSPGSGSASGSSFTNLAAINNSSTSSSPASSTGGTSPSTSSSPQTNRDIRAKAAPTTTVIPPKSVVSISAKTTVVPSPSPLSSHSNISSSFKRASLKLKGMSGLSRTTASSPSSKNNTASHNSHIVSAPTFFLASSKHNKSACYRSSTLAPVANSKMRKASGMLKSSA